MKALVFALFLPVALCTACSKTDDSVATSTTVPAPVEVPPAAAPAPTGTTSTAPAAGNAPASAPAPVEVSLVSAPGNSVSGVLTVTHQGDAVSIQGEITGLRPGREHGFHVHDIGECALPDFASAGEHFNPTKDPHGGPSSRTRHLGDLPNAKADNNGRAAINVEVTGPTLVDKDGAPTQILGKALVVHAMEDDYKTQPSGNSGARIACGVIR